MPTLIGICFILASIYLFIRGSEKLFCLLVFSSVFQAASIVSSKSFGIQPYYFVAIVFIVRCGLDHLTGASVSKRFAGKRPLILFALLGIISSALYPILFAGIPVYDPALGIDVGLLVKPALHFQASHLLQGAILCVNVLVVLSAATLKGASRISLRWFAASFYFVIAVIGLQFAFLHLGLHFPSEILNNNSSYSIRTANLDEGLDRPNGTFSEPSMTGAMLACASVAFCARYLKYAATLTPALLSLLGIVLVASSSSLAATSLCVALLLLSHPIFRWPWYIRTKRLKRTAVFLLIGCLLLAMLAIPAVRQSLLAQTAGKSDSQSFISRSAADLYALHLAGSTYWMGVGLGNNRPSSLLTALLSTVGALGLVLFATVIVRIFKNDMGDASWIKWGVVALLLDMSLGIPDVSFPILWVALAIGVRMTRDGETPDLIAAQMSAADRKTLQV